MELATSRKAAVSLLAALVLLAFELAPAAPLGHPDPIVKALEPYRALLDPATDVAAPVLEDPTAALVEAVETFAREVGVPIEAGPKVAAAGLDAALTARLAVTVAALVECNRATRDALGDVSLPEQRARFVEGEGIDPERFAGVAACAGPLWDALGGLELHLVASEASLKASATASGLDLWPVLRVELGSTDDTYVYDYALIVDVAGNDTYDNNAGGNMMDFNWGPEPAPNRGPAKGCQTALQSFTAGECAPAAAVLLDLAGDDTYGVFKTPDVDGLCTNDLVVRRTSTAGSGLAGVGYLRDVAGNDRYNGKSAAMGAGHVFGIGVLSEGGGDDQYLAVRNSQGYALLGGFGLLHDEHGDDSYDWFMPSAIDPGAANEKPGAGGVVDDVGLCDRIPRLVQGVGNIGQGLGVLIDDVGDDSYRGVFSPTYGSSIAGGVPVGSQGYGAQGGTGLFFDRSGNDTYTGIVDRADGVTVPPNQPTTGTGLFVDTAERTRVLAVGTQFAPAVVTVPVGGTVRWENDSAAGLMFHTVSTAASAELAREGVANDPTNDDGDPDSFDEVLAQGSVVEHTFNRPGTFHYFCRPHHDLAMVGTVVVTGPVTFAASEEVVPVWHDGHIFDSLEFANDGQDPVKCAENQNHHTHVGAPGEGADVSGWCDALVFRQRTFTVPTELPSDGDEEPRGVATAVLNVSLRFASGDEPPTDQLPRDEAQRPFADAQVMVTDADGNEVATTVGPGNDPFRSPHVLAVPLTPGESYTITVDPYGGIHVEWRIDADLAITLAD